MDKPLNHRAWFLVLPVFAIVAFSAIMPLMTVVNYSVQDTFGNNQFFWNGVGWFQELLDPGKAARRPLLRGAVAQSPLLRDHPRDRDPARHRGCALACRARAGRSRSASS